MNELEHIPDDFWRKAFDGAEEQPPQRVWNAVERQLDEDSKTRVLPLWGTALLPGLRTLTWGTSAAASVALLLTGWWYTHRAVQPQATGSVLARVQTHSTAPTEPRNAQSLLQPDHKTTLVASASKANPELPAHRAHTSAQSRDKLAFAVTDNSGLIADVGRQYSNLQPEQTTQFVQVSGTVSSPASATDMPSLVSMPLVATSPTATEPPTVAGQPNLSSSSKVAVVNASSYQATQSKATATWADPSATTDIAITDGMTKAKKREKWASISVMPGAYNPAVTLASAAPVAVASYASNVSKNTAASAPVVDSRSSRSMAYQVSAGIQLTERWSVESGVGYLSAQSTVESPAQVGLSSVAMITAKDAQATNNLFVDAVRSRVTSQTNAYASVVQSSVPQSYVAGRYSSGEQQTVSNDYQFVQVPVQVGYQLRPRKRLGLALIGGFLTNIFVRNTVANQVVVSPGDDIYRSLSWAASVGARFRYRPSQHWSASLAGLYQPTIGNSTVSDSPIRSHPTTAGMSFGVDYHF